MFGRSADKRFEYHYNSCDRLGGRHHDKQLQFHAGLCRQDQSAGGANHMADKWDSNQRNKFYAERAGCRSDGKCCCSNCQHERRNQHGQRSGRTQWKILGRGHSIKRRHKRAGPHSHRRRRKYERDEHQHHSKHPCFNREPGDASIPIMTADRVHFSGPAHELVLGHG